MVSTRARLEALDTLRTSIRRYFKKQGLVEVQAPMACQFGTTDPALHSVAVELAGQRRYLQTSPEFALKRLLAQNSGDIYAFATAFRDDEVGQWHSPEFTLLEWYRLGFDHHQLMDDVEALIRHCWDEAPAIERISHADLYREITGVDSHASSLDQLKAAASQFGFCGDLDEHRGSWLDALWVAAIEPAIQTRALLVYDFTVEQAALARLGSVDGQPVAHRFELVIHGVELANGFWELTDAKEQARRFESDRSISKDRGLEDVLPDSRLLGCLDQMPSCAGVALGFERLAAMILGYDQLASVQALAWEDA